MTNHKLRSRLTLAFGLTVLPLLLAYYFLDLAHWSLAVPFVYGNPGHDEVWQLILTKMLTDSGWVLTSPFMGAPDIAHWHYHSAAQTSALHSVIMLGLSPFFSDAVQLQQFYYVINFSLITMATFWCARRLEIDQVTACCLGLLFAFTTFRFNAPFFAFLVNYFAIPLAMISVFDVIRGTFFELAGETSTRARISNIFRSREFLVGLLGVCIVASADGYYAFFTVLLLGFAFCTRLAAGDYKRWPSLLPAVVYTVSILGIALALLVPLAIYKANHHDEFFPGGKEDPTLIKHAFEAEVYSSSLKLLLSPATNHRIEPLARLGEEIVATSNAGRKYPTGQMISIGTLGGLLLLGAFLLLGTPSKTLRLGGNGVGVTPRSDRRMPVIWAALALALFSFLCSIAGGVGSLVALVYPTIRAYDRFPLFLLTVLYMGGGWLFSKWLTRQSRATLRRGYVALGLVTAFAILDQVPRDAAKTDPALMNRYLAERSVVQRLESELPKGSMVYQYPYSQYLQDNKYYGWGAFSHLRLYLHSKDLRWSNGASKNSPVDSWHMRLAQQPFNELISSVDDAGFRAVVFDKTVMPPDEYKRVIDEAQRYTGNPVIEDKVSGLATVLLKDRGYFLSYGPDYKDVVALTVTDPTMVKNGSVSDRINQDELIDRLDQVTGAPPYQIATKGVLENQAVVVRGSGNTKILPISDVTGSMTCPTAGESGFAPTDLLQIQLTNKSSFSWNMDSGAFPLRVGVHVLGRDNTLIRWDDGTRLDIKARVPRNKSRTVSFDLAKLDLKDIPASAGDLKVQFEMVQDGHSWVTPITCSVNIARP